MFFFSGASFGGLSVGRPAAVSKQVSKLDKKVLASNSHVNHAPEISSFTVRSSTVAAGGIADIVVNVTDQDGDTLTHIWTSTTGVFDGSGAEVVWQAPSVSGVYEIKCTVSDGKSVVSSTVSIFATAPGSLKWKFSLPGAALFRPSVGFEGVVYVGDASGNITAINPDGTTRWQYGPLPAPADFRLLPAARGGVYVVAGGQLYAIDDSGTLLWGPSAEMSSSIVYAPVIGGDDYIYAVDSSGVHSISPDTGYGSSTFTALGVPALPLVAGVGGKTYIVDATETLYVVPREGLATSTAADVSGISQAPAFGPDGTIFVVKNDTDLYALNKDGTGKWGPFSAANNVLNGVAAGLSGDMYFADEGWTLFRISGAPATLASFSSLAGVYEAPVAGADGVIYASENSSDVYAIAPSGAVLWGPVSVDGAASVVDGISIAADGMAYFCDDGGQVYAVYSTSSFGAT